MSEQDNVIQHFCGNWIDGRVVECNAALWPGNPPLRERGVGRDPTRPGRTASRLLGLAPADPDGGDILARAPQRDRT